MTEVLFVIGTGRCGSTLVEEVLCRHPATGFLSNLEDRFALPPGAGRWNGPLYRRLPAAATTKGRLRFAPSEGYRALAREVSPLLVAPQRDLLVGDVTTSMRRRLRRFVEGRAEVQQAPVFVHKLTGWPRVGLLAEVFPQARFIHVTRAGKDVARSWERQPWFRPEMFGPLPLHWSEPAALQAWRMLEDAYDVARARMTVVAAASRWFTVSYEFLIADPRAIFNAMLGFAGLDWTDSFEQGFRKHTFIASDLRGKARP